MKINELPFIMIKCLILTIIIELVIGIIIGIRNKKDIANIILVNVFTNPLVTSIPIFMYIFFGYYLEIIFLILLEIFALLSEGYIYKKVLIYNKINPFLISLILNLSSYGLGLLINKIWKKVQYEFFRCSSSYS